MVDTPVTRSRSGPVHYEIVDLFGNVLPTKFAQAAEAAMWATHRWPDQKQDEERTGQGWDIQVVGCEP